MKLHAPVTLCLGKETLAPTE